MQYKVEQTVDWQMTFWFHSIFFIQTVNSNSIPKVIDHPRNCTELTFQSECFKFAIDLPLILKFIIRKIYKIKWACFLYVVHIEFSQIIKISLQDIFCIELY